MDVALPLVLAPTAFVAIWLGVTYLLSVLSGFRRLAERYPDRAERAMLELTWLSGTMGIGVSYRNILRLSACPSGLRVGVNKFFAPFTGDVLVPWEKLKVRRTKWMFNDLAELSFGDDGKLTVLASVADQLKAAAGKHWPAEGR